MGVIIAFVVMIVLVWKKVPLALSGVIAAVVLCLLSGLPLLETMKGPFMEGCANFIKSWFLLFLICAIYAAAMDASGAAYSLGKWVSSKVGAKYAIWGVSLAAFILTYGGISCFVIIFAMYPIALVVFQESNISRRLIPAAIGAGAFLSPNTLIGSPAVCNIIPTQALGTTATAAPLVSVTVSILMYVVANIYLIGVVKRDAKHGRGFVMNEKIQKVMDENKDRKTVSPLLAILPLAVIIITLNVLKFDVLIAMFCGTVVVFALFWKRIDSKLNVLISGTQSGITSVMTVCPAVGLGNIVKITPVFDGVIGWVTNMKGSPLISWAIASALLSFMCSSGSGAQAIMNDLLAPTYLGMGLNPEILHRINTVAILAAGNTPWNGTMCLTMSACDLSHREAYPQLILTTGVAWLIGTIFSVVMGIILY